MKNRLKVTLSGLTLFFPFFLLEERGTPFREGFTLPAQRTPSTEPMPVSPNFSYAIFLSSFLRNIEKATAGLRPGCAKKEGEKHRLQAQHSPRSCRQASSCFLPLLSSLTEKGGKCRGLEGKTKSPAVSQLPGMSSRITLPSHHSWKTWLD